MSQANELLTQIQCYVDANSKTSAVVTTKPLPRLKMIDQHTRVPALDDEDALKLISRIAGRPVEIGEMYGWPESMRDAARRPLFAVMIGSELRRRPGLYIERPVQLINRLAQHVVENSRHEGEKVNRLLQELAVNAISTGRRVRKADLTVVQSEHRQLADSLLIDEHDDTIDFTLQILRDLYAAQAIVEGTTSIAGISVLPAPDGPFIHPRAAERTKLCSSHNRPAPEAVTSARADVRPTGAPAFRAFLRHRSTLVPFLRQAGFVALAARQPAGTGSAQILRSMSPNSRRVRCPSASRSQ